MFNRLVKVESERTSGEHTLHGDAAAITVLLLVARFVSARCASRSVPQVAAHVNCVFGRFRNATPSEIL